MKHLRNMRNYLFFVLSIIGIVIVSNNIDAMNSIIPDNNLENMVPYNNLGVIEGNTIVISNIVDLKGGICKLPPNMTLVYRRGGMLRNGTVIGDHTKIQGKKCVFDKVTISGVWSVPVITTDMFANLNYENSLRDVMSLTSEEIHNKVYISKGVYYMRITKNNEACISVKGNTDLVIDGDIVLQPNSFHNYSIIRIKSKNVKVSGKGSIIGDKFTHEAVNGEWGMGIHMLGASNTDIKGLTIKDCWGDCIYIGASSNNISIRNCILDNGRRQGISITSGNNIIIKDCCISNVYGTNPQYAIDIEPNNNDIVDNVLLKNIKIDKCIGGITASKGRGDSSKKHLGEVVIKKCYVSLIEDYSIRIADFDKAIIDKCIIYSNNKNSAIFTYNTKDVLIKRNRIVKDRSPVDEMNNDVNQLIDIQNESLKEVKKNRLFTR